MPDEAARSARLWQTLAGYPACMSSTDVRALPNSMRFGVLDIAFDHRVLRPRPWTAAQSRWAAELSGRAPDGPVLELCAGAGQIGLLAIVGTDRHLVAVDADPVACGFARRNAATAGLDARTEVRQGQLEETLADDEQFAVVIADPPWVPSAHTVDYPEDPLLAIDGGPDGLGLARRCVTVAGEHLAPGGVVLLQLGGIGQVDELRDRLRCDGADLTVTEVRQPDPAGVVVCLRRTTDVSASSRTR